jgi:hypothetical protein
MKKRLISVGIILALILLGITGISSLAGVGDWFLLTDDPSHQGNPEVTYNSSSDQYLVIWEDARGTGGVWDEIYAQFVNSDGTLAGTNFPVVTVDDPYDHQMTDLRLAYNATTNRYLVVWCDYEVDEVFGQQVNANGSLFGSEIAIPHTTPYQANPDVVYNPSANQFMVVFDDYAGPGSDIYGAFVNADGTLAGADFPITTATRTQLTPVVAYGAADQLYLVAWYDYSLKEVHGQFVNENGTMAWDELFIAPLGESGYPKIDIAYAPALNAFLVVWVSDWDIYGRLIRANQTFVGPEFQMATGGVDYLDDPAVSFDPNSNQFLVTWNNTQGWGSIDARLVDANGQMPEPSFEVAGGIKRGYYYPDVAFGSNANQFLVVWQRSRCLTPECDYAEANVYGALYQVDIHYDQLYLPLVINK